MDIRLPLVCPVLVGRDDLLATADGWLAGAVDGQGGVRFVAGEAGIGKTRLIGSIERRAVARGMAAVRGGTYPGDLEIIGAVLLDLARNLGRQERFAAVGRAITGRLLETPSEIGSSDDDQGDAHRRRRILALDLADLLRSLADDGPVLVTLEDLHQADDLTLAVISSLAQLATTAPIVVLGTYRSDELFPRIPMREWRSLLLTKRLAEEVRLERLTAEDTATMTSLLLGSSGVTPRELADTIHRRTDGIPLHVEELLGMLGADASLDPDSSGQAVPDTLDDAILGRVGRRSDAAREVAEVGAVIGRSFELNLLASAVGTEPEQLAGPLLELEDHFVLAESAISGRYGFRHGLICDAIYARIPAPRRQRLHEVVADRAAELGAFGDAFLSSHYERAGRPEAAFEPAVRAADAATRVSSHREALRLYERALRTAPPDRSAADRARLHEAYGHAAVACDENTLAVGAFEAARAAWLEAGRPVEAADLVATIVAIRHLLGDDLDRRVDRLRSAVAELDALPPSTEVDRARARLMAGLSASYMLARHLDASIAAGEQAQALADVVDDDATARNASVTVGACLVFAGEMAAGWDRLAAAIRDAQGAHQEAEAARAYRMLGTAASVLVDYARAEPWLREGIEYAERVELWNHRHYMAAHLAHVLWAMGRWEESERVAEQALADGRGGITTRITALHALGCIALGRGRWLEARARLGAAYEAGVQMRELQRLSPPLWGLAEVDFLTGAIDSAIGRCEQGYAASAEVEDAAYLFPFLVTGTRAYLAARDPSRAAEWVARVSVALRRRNVPGTLPAIDHAEGLLALGAGSPAQAQASLGRAVEGWAELHRAWEGTAARIDLAEALQRGGRPRDAIRVGTSAREAAAALPAPPLLDRLDALLRRVRADRRGEAPWAPLTAREFEIARRIVDGGTNAAIAEELGLSARTIASHVEHMFAKLGLNRRAEIAAWAATIIAGEAREAR